MATGIALQSPGSGGIPLAIAAPADIDASLMLRVRQGDTASFSRLLERHRFPVISFLFRMVQNRAIAEELAQEAFLRVYRSRENYEPSAKFTTWMFRIATNLAFNWLRDEKALKSHDSLQDDETGGAGRRLSDKRPNVESVLVDRVKLKEVREAIERLPAKQRAAVLMHKYEEMDYSEIARELVCSKSAVKSLLFRAHENLRASLSHYA